MKVKKNKKKWFTIIETVVVLTIISIIVSAIWRSFATNFNFTRHLKKLSQRTDTSVALNVLLSDFNQAKNGWAELTMTIWEDFILKRTFNGTSFTETQIPLWSEIQMFRRYKQESIWSRNLIFIEDRNVWDVFKISITEENWITKDIEWTDIVTNRVFLQESNASTFIDF